MHHHRPTLVLGATGKTGRRVIARLATVGHAVRAGSRAGTPPFDWNDRATWPAVVDGAGAAYIAYAPDLALPGAADDVAAFADLAVRRGVRRLVLLSGRAEERALAGEQAVRESGAEWTVVRASWFFQNFSEHFLTDAIVAGELALPVGDVLEPFIDADDIADVAVAALTTSAHLGRVVEVTGPRLLSFADVVGEIGAAIGRDVRFVPVSPEVFTAAMTAAGLPPGEAAGLTDLFATVLDGRNASVADGVERVLGRSPRDIRGWVAEIAATGVWDVPPVRETA